MLPGTDNDADQDEKVSQVWMFLPKIARLEGGGIKGIDIALNPAVLTTSLCLLRSAHTCMFINAY